MSTWAENKVEEIARDAHIMIRDGWSRRDALDFLKSQTILGEKYWKKVEAKI